MSAQFSGRLQPDDFSSDAEETDFYRPPEKYKPIESLTPQEALDAIKHNFYIDPKFGIKEPMLSPKSLNRWIAITGPSGSGKHTIAAKLAGILVNQPSDQELVTDAEILRWLESEDSVKNQIAAEKDGNYGDANREYVWITAIGYFTYLRLLTEHTGLQPAKKFDVVTTWDAVSTWNLMAHYYSQRKFDQLIERHKLRDPLWETPTIQELADSLSQETLQVCSETITDTVNAIRQSGNTPFANLCPLTDSPRGLTLVCGLSLRECENNRQKPSTERFSPRRWEKFSDELQMQIRLVDAWLIRQLPETFIPINSQIQRDFAEVSSKEILEKSAVILRKFRN